MLSRNFTKEEFRCPCCGEMNVNMEFIEILQTLRDEFDKVMHVNSGYRCPEHNKEVGGGLYSQHMKGVAADVSTKGYSANDKWELVRLAMDMEMTGVGIGRDYIHLDIREDVGKLWVY